MLYVTSPGRDNAVLLQELGKFRMGKSCIYFKRLSDLNLDVLEELAKANMEFVQENPDLSHC